MDISEKLSELWAQLMEEVKAAAEYMEQLVKDAMADAALLREMPEYPYIRKIRPHCARASGVPCAGQTVHPP